MQRKLALPGVALALLFATASQARVVAFVVESRQPFLGGVAWGSVGPYERLTGTAHMEADPRDPLNAGIVDVDKAPRNARGMVEYSTAFVVVKPVDMTRGNQKIYYGVNNRGNNPFSLLTATTTAQVASYDVFFTMGYTLVDAGWEGDVLQTATNLAANLPIARQPDGSSIVGVMRVEYSDRNLPLAGTFTQVLEGNASFRSYETADTNTAHSVLTVRDDVDSPKVAIPSDRWAFGKCPTGQGSLTASTFDICYFDKFQNNKIYELIYPAKNPTVMGLGHATTRDVGSFLRYAARDDAGNPNPLGTRIRRSYATGASQTAGYLRDFMYLGFNEDESHRKVFDGILPTIGGTDRVFINVRFADPNIWSDQDDRHDLLQTSYPPFHYGVTTDSVSGIRDGVLKRPATDPLVMQTDSETEFWQLRGSLNVTDGQGRPVDLPDNVRLYFNSSAAHSMRITGLRTNPPGTSALCANPSPGGTVIETARATLVDMDLWADRGIEPPRSNYPRLEEHTLIPLDEAGHRFPRIPGGNFPAVQNQLDFLVFGPLFGQFGGALSLQPPILGPRYQQFVPRSDEDGLNVAGVRPMQVRAPLGTSSGWNIRAAGHRAPNLCGLTGSYFAFATTKADRTASGDPRRSLQERYRDHDGFVRAVERAARELVRERFLLQQDADAFVAAAQVSTVLQ
jgi:Alpha/beta hydrolase domain